MASLASEIIFWSSGLLLGYAFVGYGKLIGLASRWFPKAPLPGEVSAPVSVIVAAHNEAPRIAARIRDLFETHYDGPMELILVLDGCTDESAAVAASIGDPRVRVIEQRARTGKAGALNIGVANAASDLLLFTDVRQRFDRNAIANLARWFSDPAVAAVSGSLEIAAAESNTGRGVDAYWKLEKRIRASESILDSCIGCTGAIYMLRKASYSSIPEDTLLDDVVIPMQASLRGGRILFDPEAVAWDDQTLEPERELRRKQRTLAGNFQMLFRYPEWLLPWRNRLWFQLISHKYLRLAGPYLLALLFSSHVTLLSEPLYLALMIPHVGFYLLAFSSKIPRFPAQRFARLAAAFLFLNGTAFLGLLTYLSRRQQPGWR